MPPVIRWPKGFGGGRVVDENVNLCDLFASASPNWATAPTLIRTTETRGINPILPLPD